MQLDFIPRTSSKLNKKETAHYYAQGQVPAAVYGKSIEPGLCFVSIRHARSWHKGSMFDVTWQGKSYKASIAEIQHHPVNHQIHHVSFHLVGKNEVTHIDVPFRVTGSAPGEKVGGMVSLQRESITLKGKPDHMPEYIEIDVSELEVNGKITLADIPCPANTEWYHAELDWNLVTCSHAKVQSIDEAKTETEEVSAEAEAPVEEQKQAA